MCLISSFFTWILEIAFFLFLLNEATHPLLTVTHKGKYQEYLYSIIKLNYATVVFPIYSCI